MGKKRGDLRRLPTGEQPVVERVSAGPVVAADFAGLIHVEWDGSATVTPLGQLPFFIELLKQGGLFDGFVADCPLHYTSPNAPNKRDVLGTVMLSVLAGHWRYAHMTTLRCDPVNPPLLGMTQVVSEDAVRRALDKIDDSAGLAWLQSHLDYTTRPLLSEPWILDIDTTVKPLYGHQEGAVVSYNPNKRGRTVAQLSLLHDGQSAPRAGGGGRARQPPYVQAFLTAIVGVVGWPRRRTAALADSRRCRVRQRAGDVRSRAAPPALSFQAASDQRGEAPGRAGDGRAGLAECRGALAGQGRPLAA